MPTWCELGSWYGCPPISIMWKPSGNMTAAKQNSTTVWQENKSRQLGFILLWRIPFWYSLAVNPTHRAYGMTSRSQLLDANRIIAVVIQMQPTKMQISANSHSGCSSGVKHTCGRLYSVIQVHIKPSRVSPKITLIFQCQLICSLIELCAIRLRWPQINKKKKIVIQ